MRSQARLYVFVLTVFLLGVPALADADIDAAANARAALAGFDKVVEKAIADMNVPGLAIAVVAGGEVVYAEGFGYRDVDEIEEIPFRNIDLIGPAAASTASSPR